MNSDNFVDAIFIVNMRIRMIRDTLRLNPPPELFLERTLDDLAFIDWVLSILAEVLTTNEEYAYASDTEWQFSQLLTEFSAESSPFSSATFIETRDKIAILRETSDERRKAIEESDLPVEMAKAEPVVSSAELSGLLGNI